MVAHNYEKIDHRAQKEEESIRNGTLSTEVNSLSP